MGNLKPDVTYIYEKANGKIYAREFGSNDRTIVGYDLESHETAEYRSYLTRMDDVIAMCETDPAMRELLDQLFVLYNLKKTNER